MRALGEGWFIDRRADGTAFFAWFTDRPRDEEPPMRLIAAVVVAALANPATIVAADPCLSTPPNRPAGSSPRAGLPPGHRAHARHRQVHGARGCRPENDRRRHAEVLARVENVISEGRAQGAGPCETLARIMKIVANQ